MELLLVDQVGGYIGTVPVAIALPWLTYYYHPSLPPTIPDPALPYSTYIILSALPP